MERNRIRDRWKMAETREGGKKGKKTAVVGDLNRVESGMKSAGE